MFPVMCADIINCLERLGREGGFETPNWTKEGKFFFSIFFFPQKPRKEGASGFILIRVENQLFSGPRGGWGRGGAKERAVGQNNRARGSID